MTPMRQVTLQEERFVIPIPMRYDSCDESEQGFNLKVGKLYGLQGESCDEFAMPMNVFICKGIVNDYHGTALDVAIMKHVEGEEGHIFSLTRNECKMLGVEYEPKLQVFPIEFNWIPMEHQEARDYTPNNLGTYKPSPITGTIKQMHVFMRMVRPCGNSHLYTPNDSAIPTELFLKTIRVYFKDINLRNCFKIEVKPLLTRGENSPLFDTDRGGINFMLFFSDNANNGIDPHILENKTFDNLFVVTWQEPDMRRLNSTATSRPRTTDNSDYIFKLYNDYIFNIRKKIL